MGYVLGISSGLWRVGREDNIFGIIKKGYYSITYGVRFTQIDIDSITEFKDPFLKQGIEELKRFGIEFGFHGETTATSAVDVIGFDSAIKDVYEITHKRLIEQINAAGELGAKYLLFHASESSPFQMLYREFQPSKLVDFWGRPLRELIESEKFLWKFVFESNVTKKIWEFLRIEPQEVIERRLSVLRQHIRELLQSKITEATQKVLANVEAKIRNGEIKPEERDKAFVEEYNRLKEEIEKEISEYEKSETERLKNEVTKDLLDSIDSYDLNYGPERFAYYVVAKYMNETKDPLWMGIVGRKLSDEEIFTKPEIWVPAVATKYVWGHFNPSPNFEDPKPLLEKYKMYIVWETGLVRQGYEGMARIARPKELYYLAKNLGTKWSAWCLDMEHILATCYIDLKKEIEELPDDAGAWLKVVHVAYPSPLHGHKPIPLGSEAQEYIYEILYILRQKGFKEGWILHERGDKPAFQTMEVLRRIKEFLEKDVPPNELPPEFYGFEIDEPEVIRQEQIVLQHALDPLKGLLAVPEEEHTFLSKIALERGRLEQWKKEEMR